MSDTFLGKPTNIVGVPSKELILLGSALKFLWGSKFIDIIKNGKINTEKILKTISDEDSVSTDGIYLTDDNKLVVCVNGSKLSIGEAVSSYISYLEEQKDLTSELKLISLLNSGFYYRTLLEAKDAKISSGVIFNLEDSTFYLAKEGELTKFEFISEKSTVSNVNENINEFISFLDNLIDFKKPLRIGDTEIQELSIKTTRLECEELITPTVEETIKSTQDNIIISLKKDNITGYLNCKLRNKNLFSIGDKIFIIDEPVLVTLEINQETNKIRFKLSNYTKENVIILYLLENSMNRLTINAGTLYSEDIEDSVISFTTSLTDGPYIIEGSVMSVSELDIYIELDTERTDLYNKKIIGTGSSILPPKTIMIYYGENAPYGWQFCDGTNGTPNLTLIAENVKYIMKL